MASVLCRDVDDELYEKFKDIIDKKDGKLERFKTKVLTQALKNYIEEEEKSGDTKTA